jgi:N-methylhydantoinase B
MIDPITVEVIGSALSSIAEEMGEALVRASYSTNIKERRDCSTALFDISGNTLCQAEHIPMHLGSFIGIIPHILKRHDVAAMQPGDVFIGNDAYEGGGTHLPDIVLAEPIFVEGRIIAWAVNTAHHADFADRGHAHIYQEAIRIPPIRLYAAGQLCRDVQDLILLNCQVPRERLSDLRAQMAANRLGVARMGALAGKYGVATLLAAGVALQDYAEKKMRAGIAAIPDGTYRFSDRLDSISLAEDYEIGVVITVAGETMHLAFSAPPQVRGPINLVYTALLSSVYYAVKTVVDPTILPNAGLARPLSVAAPPGSILNCSHPAAVDARMNGCQRVADLVLGALAQAVPERVIAAASSASNAALFSGAHEDGRPWIYLDVLGGGSGARASKDGLDGVQIHMTNTSNLPGEAMEAEYPLSLLRYELVDGSGGVGKFRGGMGLRRSFRVDAPCRLELQGARFTSAPWGLFGGGAGAMAQVFCNGEAAPAGGIAVLAAGDTVEIVTPGGGGYGPPGERDPDLAARDRREGRIMVLEGQA